MTALQSEKMPITDLSIGGRDTMIDGIVHGAQQAAEIDYHPDSATLWIHVPILDPRIHIVGLSEAKIEKAATIFMRSLRHAYPGSGLSLLNNGDVLGSALLRENGDAALLTEDIKSRSRLIWNQSLGAAGVAADSPAYLHDPVDH